MKLIRLGTRSLVAASFTLLVAASSAGAEQRAESPASGPIRVRAESYERTPGHLALRGVVDLRFGEMRVQADQADVYDAPRPDGSLEKRIVADGNVVFMRGGERLAGDHLEVDGDGRGVLLNVVGYLEPGLFVEAQKLERLDDRRYRVEGGSFSSCAQPTARWSFSATRAGITLDDRITARNAVFKVKGVPAFYSPYVLYPIRRDERATGFLMPSLGYSSLRGMTASAGFFWAMGRSADQTFTLDSWSRLGYGLGHELRWMGASLSRGVLRSAVSRVSPESASAEGTAPTRQPAKYVYDIDWSGQQQLPGKLRLRGSIHEHSDLVARQQQLQQSWTASQDWEGSLERDLGFAVVSAFGRSRSSYLAATAPPAGPLSAPQPEPAAPELAQGQASEAGPARPANPERKIDETWPALRLQRFPRPIGWGGIVFGLDAAAEELHQGLAAKPKRWSRYSLAPTLSRSFSLSFLDVTPSVGYRWARYGTRVPLDANGTPSERRPSPIARSYVETAVRLAGPTFSRVFDTPGFGYSERFKHTIGPEITWTYSTDVDDAAAIPYFDSRDRFAGRNQVHYALAQRLYAKRGGANGKSMPYEILSWRLEQTYYVRNDRGQSGSDPNYSWLAGASASSSRHLSRIQSTIRLQPAPGYSLDSVLSYDADLGQLASTTLTANVDRPRFQLWAVWSRTSPLATGPRPRAAEQMIRGSAALDVVPNRLSLQGSIDYDLENRRLMDAAQRMRLGVQCCGLVVEHVQLSSPTSRDDLWRFSLELANVGSVGSVIGADPTRADRGRGGF